MKGFLGGFLFFKGNRNLFFLVCVMFFSVLVVMFCFFDWFVGGCLFFWLRFSCYFLIVLNFDCFFLWIFMDLLNVFLFVKTGICWFLER